jgi:ABC-type Fe3+/spermidine/putrescine transport system ATPase subunit
MSTHLVLHQLTKRYDAGAEPTVDKLDLDVEPGTLVALLGPSGCGKTTSMKLIAGLLDPSGGDIRFDDRSILGVPPERRPVAMVFQKPLLFPHMTVEDNIGFGLRMRKVERAEIRRRVGAMLELVRLPGMERRRVGELSGGQEQRVALARALVIEPQVLLLDEPLSQLDANLRIEMRDLIRSLQRDLELTALFVTHDQEEAVVLADRVGLMLDGRLQQFDVPKRFYDRPATARVARFFGTQNLLPGRVRDDCFVCDLGAIRLAERAADGPGLLAIRQEAIELGHGTNAVQAVVERTLYMGTHLRLWVQASGRTLECTVDPNARLEAGERVTLRLPPEHCWVVPAEGAG